MSGTVPPRPEAGLSAQRPPAPAPPEPLQPLQPPEPLQPLDPPMVPFTVAGLVVWAIAALAMLPFRDTHESWWWICVAGFLWGILGLAVMLRHDANRRRRR